MKYHFKVHREKSCFFGECLELIGCRSQGKSREELGINLAEALNLFLDEPSDSKLLFPLPSRDLKGRNIIEVEVEPRIAFSFYLRQIRLRKGLTQKEVARRLGIKNLFGYQRLESSKYANPALDTIARIKTVFPEFQLDEVIG